MLLLTAGAVLAAVVALTFRPFILPVLLELSAWPHDEAIGKIPVLDAPDLRPAFEGKRVLIVGGTRGVGFGVAQAISKAGGRVTLVGRSRATAQKALDVLGDNASFIPGDIGTVSSAKDTVAKIVEFVAAQQQEDSKEGKDEGGKFDYLVVSAAFFPDWSGTRPHQQDDGIDAPFAVAVVGRYIIYKNMNKFLKPSGTALNVMASGQFLHKVEIDRELSAGNINPRNLVHSITNFNGGNDVIVQLIGRDPDLTSYTIVSTHPGFVRTDLQAGQGSFVEAASTVVAAVAGVSVEVAGLQHANILASPKLHRQSLSYVSCDQKGRKPTDKFQASVEEHLPWLQEFLHSLKADV